MPAPQNIFHKRPGRNDWLIILSNLIPVFGALFLGWNAAEVFTVYAMETMIAGIFTILKLLIATFSRGSDDWYNGKSRQKMNGLFFIFFFILHFGIFAAVQTAVFSSVSGIAPPGKGVFHFFFHWWEYINGDIAWMLAGFVVSYLLRDLIPFIQNKEYKSLPMIIIMFQPYGRVVIQQFTVILGSMFLTFGLGAGFILVFALAKIFVEVFLSFDEILKKTAASFKKRSGEE